MDHSERLILQLFKDHSSGRLKGAYLICTDDIDFTILGIENFLSKSVFKQSHFTSNFSIFNNLSCFVVKPESATSCKEIVIDKVRQLQSFLYGTSIIDQFKIGIIITPEAMNTNAANCLLKVLEETPSGNCIFLITEHEENIISTILSRCIKIKYYKKTNDVDEKCYTEECVVIDQDIISAFINIFDLACENPKFSETELLIKKVSTKIEIFDRFIKNIEHLVYKFWKKAVLRDIYLNDLETQLLNKFEDRSEYFFREKYKSIIKIINDFKSFNLDITSTCLLIVDEFLRIVNNSTSCQT